jgi:hypothetical protein
MNIADPCLDLTVNGGAAKTLTKPVQHTLQADFHIFFRNHQ